MYLSGFVMGIWRRRSQRRRGEWCDFRSQIYGQIDIVNGEIYGYSRCLRLGRVCGSVRLFRHLIAIKVEFNGSTELLTLHMTMSQNFRELMRSFLRFNGSQWETGFAPGTWPSMAPPDSPLGWHWTKWWLRDKESIIDIWYATDSGSGSGITCVRTWRRVFFEW